jgi:hypothetical protein
MYGTSKSVVPFEGTSNVIEHSLLLEIDAHDGPPNGTVLGIDGTATAAS